MTTIKKLSPELISQISAGQVVDRPASVVKELIDNALDAGATDIRIDLEQGGLEKIVVTDNGIGMSKEDALLCFLPYTTSKIHTLDDLLHIETFGFRGEALASIAQVAEVTIDTKQASTVSGWHVRVVGGTCIESEPVGMPDGTQITVERLFYTVPARRKFVKAITTEVRVSAHVVTAYALAHPTVAFTLTHNGRDIVQVTPHQTVLDRMEQLIDARSARSARAIDYGKGPVRIFGYVGHPTTSRGSDTHMYITINNRPVHNPEIKRVIRTMYGTLLPQRSFPVCVLSIEYPFESIDVNVDPQKSHVRLYGKETIQATIKEALQDIFTESATSYTAVSGRKMDTKLAEAIKDTHTPWSPRDSAITNVTQIRRLYILAEYQKGIILYDQHAVHERILYEEYRDAFEHQRTSGPVHTYAQPLKITLSAQHRTAFDDYASALASHGCTVRIEGDEVFLMSVPAYLAHRDGSELITELIEACEAQDDGLTEGGIDPVAHRTLTYMACRSAIKAGDPLTSDEMKKLITKLMACKHPQTCPHGRPTCIHILASELDSFFQR